MRAHLVLSAVLLSACATTAERPAKEPAPVPAALRTIHNPGLEAAEGEATAAQVEGMTLARNREGLAAQLGHPDPAIRAAVALGLGRVQNAAEAERVAPLLQDPEPRVREAAATAFGLFGLSWEPLAAERKAEVEAPVIAALDAEKDPLVRRRLAWALGRIGGPGGEKALVGLLADGDPALRAEAALSLGLLARYHPIADRPWCARAVAGLWRDDEAEVRAAAAFALANLKVEAQEQTAAALARDEDAQVRAFAARALGNVAGTPSLLEALAGDPSFLVRVEAVRGMQAALVRYGGGPGPDGKPTKRDLTREDAFEEALKRTAGALAREAATKAGPASVQPLALVLRPSAGQTPHAVARAAWDALGDPLQARKAARAEVAWLRCQAAAAHDTAAGELELLQGCGAGLVSDEAIARLEASALGAMPAGDAAVEATRLARLGELLRSEHAAVRATAVEALGRREAPEARGRVAAALLDADPAVVATAADAIAKKPDGAARSALLEALARYEADAEAETAQSILAALGAVADEEAAARIAEARLDPRPAVRAKARAVYASLPPKLRQVEEPAQLPEPRPLLLPRESAVAGEVVRLETDRGTIRIALDVAHAPVASSNFRALVLEGFYDGVEFHRMEPGFVLQGGDPRGDGFGGPGWSIPCENDATPYVRGTVGMALSGKDTGGSQFFFTHGRTPHLEGRYTAFGAVLEGMDVVDRLLPGERIRKASVETP